MLHLFAEAASAQEELLTITGADVNHIRNVLRMKPGEEVCVSNGQDGREYHYGIEEFCERAKAAGIDGLILPDTPYEEKDEFAPLCAEHGISYISLIAPTSEERIAMIAAEAQGFVYCVSSLGVTGTRDAITTDIDALVARVRAATDVPVAVGFGISNASQAANMAAKSDGAIVGSALVKLVAAHWKDSPGPVGELAEQLASAVHSC